MDRVLVTDGGERSSLAVVRSLGRKGICVDVANDRIPCLASVSKFCSGGIETPDPLAQPYEYRSALIATLRQTAYELLIPTSDVATTLVMEQEEAFRPFVRLPLPSRASFFQASDKGTIIQLAKQLGVPTPRTWIIGDGTDVSALATELPYPVVVKPRRSHFLNSEGWVHGPVSYAKSASELEARLAASAPSMPLPMIQERIEGPGCGAFFLYEHGEVRASFFHRRLREKPPSGGVSVLRESISPDPEMMRFSQLLLAELKWHGVAMVEFKLDERDGIPKLMEINPRFWGSLQLAIDAGLDFPGLLHTMCTKDHVAPVTGYQVGIRSRWLLGDLDHLSARLRKSRRKLNLPPTAPGRWAALRDFFAFGQHQTKFEVNQWEDMKPFWHELRQYIKFLLMRGRQGAPG